MNPRLNPLTVKKLKRFCSIRRGFWSAVLLALLVLLSCFAELLVNSRALLVSYQGRLYFPTYGDVIPGSTFGLGYQYETNYRALQKAFAEAGEGDWLLLAPIPYNAFENDFVEGEYPPYPPSLVRRHYLGTDTSGRDIVARLVYGFRIAIWFSLILLCCNYLIGISVGCLMGYWGGAFDLIFQRIIEIWSNIPFLYVIMIIASVIVPTFGTLISVMVFFGWMGMTWYMRTATYKEAAREYVMAARALGASGTRIVFHHILPNSVAIIVTFIPFSVASGITALTALDYLGFGLPVPTPSWGELLRQGTERLDAEWIVISVVAALTLVLVMVTFVGEAVREAFDPRRYTYYE
jgi:microcin C transport system permease protein